MTIDFSLLGFQGLWQVPNVHPIFVHFPVGLIPSALFLYSIGALTGRERVSFAGRLCLYLAAMATALAVFTGDRAADTIPHNETVHELIEAHQAIGITLLVIMGLLTVWTLAQRNGRPVFMAGFLLLLAAATGLVLQNADIGARMVFVEGAAVKVVSPPAPTPTPTPAPASDEPNPTHHEHTHHDH